MEEHVNGCPACQQTLERLVGSAPAPLVPETLAPADPGEEAPPGLPGYETLGRQGAGGMGVVWRVRDLPFQRDLAVKVMRARESGQPELVARFFGEARVCARLAHPFIVPVHSMGRLPDGRPYYTMKLVEGQTLAAQLGQRPTPAHRRAEFVQVFAQVCQAVAHAHGKGVIHRDLKPANVMVGEHGEVQLMDWGLAKVLADAGPALPAAPVARRGAAADTWRLGPHRTDDGSVLGTPAYMPPEQARGPVAEVDRRSDVFGLGAILCEVLTGEPPYRGSGRHALRQAATADLGDALERLRGCGADVELVRLAERCLAPVKADRPSDAGAVARAVATYLAAVEERLHQERLARERERVEAAEQRRRRKLWMSLTVAVLAALGLAAAGGLHGIHQAALRRQEDDQSLHRAEGLIRSGAFAETAAVLEHVENGPRLDHLRLVLRLVQDLETVRLMRVTWNDGGFDCSSALDGYREAFERAGIDPIGGDLGEVVEQVRGSIVCRRLVAALDDWAYVAERERRRDREPARARGHERLRDRLLAVARQAGPGVNDSIRDPRSWSRPDRLRRIADEMNTVTTSAELLVLAGTLLGEEDREKLWRSALASHPDDFWLNAELGTLLMVRATRGLPARDPYLPREQVTAGAAALAADAAGFYRTALALRPTAAGVCLDLAGALALKGNRAGAIAYCRQALRLEPDNKEGQSQLIRAVRVRR